MNVDHILDTMNRNGVGYLLIGGMNFMLRHQPILTYDVDLWIEDSESNRRRCETALVALSAEWGATEEAWSPVAGMATGWLDRQFVYCLTSPHGAIDIFREVNGLADWTTSRGKAIPGKTSFGTLFHGLSDEDMLSCQTALSPGDQHAERIRSLREAIARRSAGP
jgi:hypothetical protein